MAALTRNNDLWSSAEVAALFGVDPKTVTRWAEAGKLSSIRTVGGHRRFRSNEVRELFDNGVFASGEWAGIVDVRETPAGIIHLRDHPGG
jgi:excisionase family DNA binding protein